MPVIVCLLRGVNIGGHNLLKMDALRALCTTLDLEEVQTHLQSGNVLFRTTERSVERLAERISNAIETSHGFRPAAILRTAAEMREIVASNPFAGRKDLHPSKFTVTFLGAAPAAEAREKLLQIKTDPEEMRLGSRELYIYFPNGMGRTKLPWPALERALRTTLTTRNWNTVIKLADLSEQLAKRR